MAVFPLYYNYGLFEIHTRLGLYPYEGAPEQDWDWRGAPTHKWEEADEYSVAAVEAAALVRRQGALCAGTRGSSQRGNKSQDGRRRGLEVVWLCVEEETDRSSMLDRMRPDEMRARGRKKNGGRDARVYVCSWCVSCLRRVAT